MQGIEYFQLRATKKQILSWQSEQYSNLQKQVADRSAMLPSFETELKPLLKCVTVLSLRKCLYSYFLVFLKGLGGTHTKATEVKHLWLYVWCSYLVH